jgi:hypothetical protein
LAIVGARQPQFSRRDHQGRHPRHQPDGRYDAECATQPSHDADRNAVTARCQLRVPSVFCKRESPTVRLLPHESPCGSHRQWSSGRSGQATRVAEGDSPKRSGLSFASQGDRRSNSLPHLGRITRHPH